MYGGSMTEFNPPAVAVENERGGWGRRRGLAVLTALVLAASGCANPGEGVNGRATRGTEAATPASTAGETHRTPVSVGPTAGATALKRTITEHSDNSAGVAVFANNR